MPLTSRQNRMKFPTRFLGAGLAVLSIVIYNQWFRADFGADFGPDPATNALPDFRVLALFNDSVVTLENKTGHVSTSTSVPNAQWEPTLPWPEPRHGGERLTEQWRTLVVETPQIAATARCVEFDGRSALVYWSETGALCALDGETGREFFALGDLQPDSAVLGPKYLSSRELAVLSIPPGGATVRLDVLRLQWHTDSSQLQFATRRYEFSPPANAEEIYAFDIVQIEQGFGGYVAGPAPLNLLFVERDKALLSSGPLPVSILSMSPDGTRAQIQTSDVGDGIAQVDWLNLRLHTPEPMATLGHETFQWSPDSRYMVIGAQTAQGSYMRLYDAKRGLAVMAEPLRTDTQELPLALWFSLTVPEAGTTAPPS